MRRVSSRRASTCVTRRRSLRSPASFSGKAAEDNWKALLEAYTCYPVVPMGFLLAAGFAGSTQEIRDFVDTYPVTITGGLNLAKAPWNNTTLYAIAQMVSRLRDKDAPFLGGIHSVGALGYKQAFAILINTMSCGNNVPLPDHRAGANKAATVVVPNINTDNTGKRAGRYDRCAIREVIFVPGDNVGDRFHAVQGHRVSVCR